MSGEPLLAGPCRLSNKPASRAPWAIPPASFTGPWRRPGSATSAAGYSDGSRFAPGGGQRSAFGMTTPGPAPPSVVTHDATADPPAPRGRRPRRPSPPAATAGPPVATAGPGVATAGPPVATAGP